MAHYPLFEDHEDRDLYGPLSRKEERLIILAVVTLIAAFLLVIMFAIHVNNEQNRWLKEDKALEERSYIR